MPATQKRRLDPPYRESGFDVGQENRALDCLARFDLAGCRKAFGRLLDSLNTTNGPGSGTETRDLLQDSLQAVNRQLYPREDPLFHLNRVSLARDFAAMDGLDDARCRFPALLNGLLSPFRSGRRTCHPLVHRARRFIEDNYRGKLSLAKIAASLAVSPGYLSRMFRRETGITLTACIQQVRLDHARAMLADGRQSISEIAYRVGYQNYRDFYRNFVKYEHASPRQVRRRLARPVN